MCRDVAIFVLNGLLDDIHNNVSVDEVRAKSQEFMTKYDYERLQLHEDEIRKDRLKEYIKLFNLSGMCEYDIFCNVNCFYDVLRMNLEPETWKMVEKALAEGNIVANINLLNTN